MNNELTSLLEKTSGKKTEPLKVKQWVEDLERNLTTLNPVVIDGIMITKVAQDEAFKIYHELYQEVKKQDFQIFLTNMEIEFTTITKQDGTKDYGTKIYYDVGIIKALNQFDIINLVKTEAGNFDLTTEDIIEKVQSWEKFSRIQLTVVDSDRVEGILLDKPKNVTKFADEIYEFAPDVIEQGTGTKKALIQDLKNGYFWLWWD